MDFQVIVESIDQTVIGVGHVAVGGKSGRARAAEQCFETRMFADFEAPAEGVGTQAVDRQRHQPFTVDAQQGGGIAGKQRAHGFEQTPIALPFGEFAGQVRDQGQQGGKQGFCCHSDSV